MRQSQDGALASEAKDGDFLRYFGTRRGGVMSIAEHGHSCEALSAKVLGFGELVLAGDPCTGSQGNLMWTFDDHVLCLLGFAEVSGGSGDMPRLIFVGSLIRLNPLMVRS